MGGKNNRMQFFSFFHKDTKEFITFVVIFLSVLWEPIRTYVFPTDGGGRIVNVLTIIAIILNKEQLHYFSVIFKSPAFKVWLVLVLYSSINSLCKGYMGINEEISLYGFLRKSYIRPLLFLSITIIGLQINRDGCLMLLLVSLLCYILWGQLNPTESIGLRYMSALGNRIPLHAVACIFVALVLWLRNNLDKKILFLLCCVCFYVIMVAGTRKAFAAYVIVCLFAIINKLGHMSFFKVLILFFISILLYWSIMFVIDNTLVGERIVHTAEKKQMYIVQNEQFNHFLNTLWGDRTRMYINGFGLFLEHPLTGIGLRNYIYISGDSHVLHTEYMVQLAENGMIGFCIFVLFYIELFRDLKRMRIAKCLPIGIYHGGIIAVLFINFTAWTYNMTYVMVIYAIVLDYIYSNESEHEDSNL